MYTDSKATAIKELIQKKPFLVVQEYRHCKTKGETQQSIRKNNKGIEKATTSILATGEKKKIRLLTFSIETEVLFSNQYKMVPANFSQVKRLLYDMKLHKNYFLQVEFLYESPFMNQLEEF